MRFTLLLCLLFFELTTLAQQQAKVGCVGFYNLENLFDIEDDPTINDSEYTPAGSKLWTEELYQRKLTHLSSVIAQMGKEVTPDGLAILGVAEVENRRVLEDLVKQPEIAKQNYNIVHYDSPDLRGIDVGLLYQPKYFTVANSKALPVLLYNEDGSRIYTRDVLLVSGIFDGDTLHVLVNHWPSRRGGEAASRSLRETAAGVVKSAVDSLMNQNINAKIIIMGDLNDDPVSSSIKKVLKSKRDVAKIKEGDLYNPMEDFYKKGIGTLAYQDAWNLFDQLIISSGLVQPVGGYQFYKAQIFNQPYMVQKEGQFKGYPLRTHAGDTYLDGYSDHFPVYLFLVKRL